MEFFLKNYGINIEMSGYFIHDAKFYLGNINYCVMALKYVIPRDFKDKRVRTIRADGSEVTEPYENIFSHKIYKQDCLRLMI